MESFTLEIIAIILTVGFAYASVLGYLSGRLKLSPIVGYLLAGYLIGPYSPGFVADIKISEQLAEVGVILMLFGVGLHFKWQDLMRVKSIAIPGALAQICITTLATVIILHFLGGSYYEGLIIGLAVSIASTMILMRVLTEYQLIKSQEGVISVGWVIVEDIITVLFLLLIPIIGESWNGTSISYTSVVATMGVAILKLLVLIIIVFVFLERVVKFIFIKIEATRSDELFAVTVLAVTFVIATGASYFFGVSVALGAFIVGMLIGQIDVHHKVQKNINPLRDVFVVIFFLSVGMLFNPVAIINHFVLFITILGIILLFKPIATFVIAKLLNQPFRSALMIAVALAQIGEFSFILAEESMKYGLLSDDGFDLLVACALISISINPLLFKLFK